MACRQVLQQGAADRQKHRALLCSAHMLSVEPSARSLLTSLVQTAIRPAMHLLAVHAWLVLVPQLSLGCSGCIAQ